MRDELPRTGPRSYELGVLNLDDAANPGTHWVAYKASPTKHLYFDSYGLPPPDELVAYLRKKRRAPLQYSTFRIQRPSDGPICGHLCISVLRRLAQGEDFLSILMDLDRG